MRAIRRAAGDNVGLAHLEPGLDKRRAAAHAVDEFERAAPEHERLRLVGSRRRLVDDPDADAVARQFGRHRQPHGAGADDKHFWFHR